MGKRKDLTERERYAIEAYRNEKRSIKEIAVLLGRHYQTIYREIKRGTVEMLIPNCEPIANTVLIPGRQSPTGINQKKGANLKSGMI